MRLGLHDVFRAHDGARILVTIGSQQAAEESGGRQAVERSASERFGRSGHHDCSGNANHLLSAVLDLFWAL